MYQFDNKNKTVSVFGDLMVDTYHYIQHRRISQECPSCYIYQEYDCKQFLGGAANVAKNLDLLEFNVNLCGFGGDLFWKVARKDKNKINICDFNRDNKYITTEKVRYIDENGVQQIRIDKEEIIDLQNEPDDNIKLINSIIERSKQLIDKSDIVVFSDYEKGFLCPLIIQPLIQYCNKKGIMTIVDPKGEKWIKYQNSTFIKCNKKEFNVANDKDCVINNTNVIVTQGKDDILLYQQDFNEPKKVQPVEYLNQKYIYSVVGAGDVFTALLTTALINGYDDDYLKIASIGSAFALTKHGTCQITLNELKTILQNTPSLN